MAFGAEVPICGQDKLKVVEWLESLIALQDVGIAERLQTLQCGRVLLRQVQRHTMNGLYQLKIVKVFATALGSSVDPYVFAVL